MLAWLRFVTATALVTAVFTTGCSVATDVKDSAEDRLDELGDAAGTHAFTGPTDLRWRSSDGAEGPVRLVFVQDRLAVTGYAAFENHPCLRLLGVEARVEWDGLHGSLTVNDVRLPFAYTLEDRGIDTGLRTWTGAVSGIGSLACAASDSIALL